MRRKIRGIFANLRANLLPPEANDGELRAVDENDEVRIAHRNFTTPAMLISVLEQNTVRLAQMSARPSPAVIAMVLMPPPPTESMRQMRRPARRC